MRVLETVTDLTDILAGDYTIVLDQPNTRWFIYDESGEIDIKLGNDLFTLLERLSTINVIKREGFVVNNTEMLISYNKWHELGDSVAIEKIESGLEDLYRTFS